MVQPPDCNPFHGDQRLSAFPYPGSLFRERKAGAGSGHNAV